MNSSFCEMYHVLTKRAARLDEAKEKGSYQYQYQYSMYNPIKEYLLLTYQFRRVHD